MRLCGLDLGILYARLKNSFVRNFPGDAQTHKYNNFDAQTESVAVPKEKNFPIGF